MSEGRRKHNMKRPPWVRYKPKHMDSEGMLVEEMTTKLIEMVICMTIIALVITTYVVIVFGGTTEVKAVCENANEDANAMGHYQQMHVVEKQDDNDESYETEEIDIEDVNEIMGIMGKKVLKTPVFVDKSENIDKNEEAAVEEDTKEDNQITDAVPVTSPVTEIPLEEPNDVALDVESVQDKNIPVILGAQPDDQTDAQPEETPSTEEDEIVVLYTLGDIKEVIEEMHKTEGTKCVFSWDETKYNEDTPFIIYIKDLLNEWYEEGKISRKWEPDESRFTSKTPYYTEEQGDYRMLANLMYAEEGVFFWGEDFDKAALANLFAGSVVMNHVTDPKGRFGKNLKEAIFTGGAYPNSTRNRVRNEECKREIIYILAEIIMQYGPIGPEEMIFQARFTQGSEIFAEIGGEYFCLP